MAVILSMTYQKKLGLPQFSSHSCSLSVQVEVQDLAQVAQESTKLYGLLQSAVDQEIKSVGFMPDVAYGIGTNGNGSNGHHQNGNGNGSNGSGAWQCSEAQRNLIEKIVSEHNLDKTDVEKVAQEMFGKGVKALNKLQASGLIEELLEKNGGSRNGNGRHQRQQPYRRQRAGAE